MSVIIVVSTAAGAEKDQSSRPDAYTVAFRLSAGGMQYDMRVKVDEDDDTQGVFTMLRHAVGHDEHALEEASALVARATICWST